MKIGMTLLLVIFASVANFAIAQDDHDALDSIEVTGSRISYEDLYETPSISLVKPADFMVKSMTMTNDTRDAALRRSELVQTVRTMIGKAGKKIEILHGGVALAPDNIDLDLVDDGKRADVSNVALKLRGDLKDWENNGASLHEAMRKLIKETKRDGRTTIEMSDDTSLSVRNPERYRYELIAAISKDVSELQKLFGDGCKVTADGLSGRIQWERASLSELLLFIRYNLVLESCSGRP